MNAKDRGEQWRPTPFLTAEWRWLLMLGWPTSADALAPRVPPGCEPDFSEPRVHD